MLHAAGIAKCVLVTQPSRLVAAEIATRLDIENGCALRFPGLVWLISVNLGNGVVSLRMGRKDINAKAERIRVVTASMLPHYYAKDNTLSDFGIIIIDEIHERSLDTDLSLGLIKRALAVRSDLRCVCMSATAEMNKLEAFFKPHNPQLIALPGQPGLISRYILESVDEVFEIDGDVPMTDNDVRGKEDEVVQIPDDWPQAAVRVTNMALTWGTGDVLIFCPDLVGISRTADKLRQIPDISSGKVGVVRLLRDEPGKWSAKAIKPKVDSEGRIHRKVILSTSVGETSITFPSVDTVIDSAITNLSIYDPAARSSHLLQVPSARDQVSLIPLPL